jgi:anaphase-promoting complex subunit 8
VLCGEKDGIRDVTLPQHWMRDFFLAHLCLEMQHNAEGLSRLQACFYRVLVGVVIPCGTWGGLRANICRTVCAAPAQALSEQFPSSEWIVCQAAIAHYNLRNFDEAEDLFQDLLERDPHRIEVLV